MVVLSLWPPRRSCVAAVFSTGNQRNNTRFFVVPSRAGGESQRERMLLWAGRGGKRFGRHFARIFSPTGAVNPSGSDNRVMYVRCPCHPATAHCACFELTDTVRPQNRTLMPIFLYDAAVKALGGMFYLSFTGSSDWSRSNHK